MAMRNPYATGAGGGGFLSGLMSSGFWGGPGGMALSSFGLPMLARLLGGGREEFKAKNQYMKDWRYGTSPQFMADRMNAYSPIMNQMMAGQRGNIMTSSNAFQNTLGRNLAASGANRSGIGALAATAASSRSADLIGDLASEGRRGTMQLAMNDRNNFLSMLQQGPMHADNRFLAPLAEGTDTFMQYMMDRNRPASRGYYG